MHSTQSMNPVKEELVKLNGKFELLDELHERGQKLMELSGKCLNLYQQNKYSKVQFSKPCKWFLDAAKFGYGNKPNESINFQKLSSRNFWQITNSVLKKRRSAAPTL